MHAIVLGALWGKRKEGRKEGTHHSPSDACGEERANTNPQYEWSILSSLFKILNSSTSSASTIKDSIPFNCNHQSHKSSIQFTMSTPQRHYSLETVDIDPQTGKIIGDNAANDHSTSQPTTSQAQSTAPAPISSTNSPKPEMTYPLPSHAVADFCLVPVSAYAVLFFARGALFDFGLGLEEFFSPEANHAM